MFRFRNNEEDSSHSQYILRINPSSHICNILVHYNTRKKMSLLFECTRCAINLIYTRLTQS